MTQDLVNKLKSFTLLYAEDEAGIQNNLNEIFQCLFKEIYLASNGEEALKLYHEKKPDLIITDIQMPKLTGIELLKQVRKRDSKTRVIITSAHTDLEYMLEATELHLVKYIVKPITESKIKDALENFIKSYEGSSIYNIIPSWSYDESLSLVKGPDEEYLLTKKENIFLKLLLQKNRIINYTEIENILWDENSVMTQNALRLFIKNFRKKLPAKILKNVQGTGYKLLI
ncbi:MAG: response regulator [Campylobacterales bacterium]|nr:response regulator [Campylobacterales bacterium]NQY52061.1 response regulator [Campylobacteraceae bacterium]